MQLSLIKLTLSFKAMSSRKSSLQTEQKSMWYTFEIALMYEQIWTLTHVQA